MAFDAPPPKKEEQNRLHLVLGQQRGSNGHGSKYVRSGCIFGEKDALVQGLELRAELVHVIIRNVESLKPQHRQRAQAKLVAFRTRIEGSRALQG